MTLAWGASFRRWVVQANRVMLGGAVLLAFSSVALLSGCGQGTDKKGTTVKGILLSDGKPLKVDDGSAVGSRAYITVYVSLHKADKESTTEAKADGTFSIEGVEPGDYTLTVKHHDRAAVPKGPQGTDGGPPKGQFGPGGGGASGPGAGSGPPDSDLLGGEFSPAKSQIKVKVGATSPQDLGTIDLKKPDTWPK